MASKRKQPEKVSARHPTRKAKVTTAKDSLLPSGYSEVLEDIKKKVLTARIRASLSVNRELIILYWEIGRMILQRQKAEGWGSKVIDRLSVDLTREFPDQRGFSARNLKYMRKFAESFPDREIVQQAAAQIPWFHNCVILDLLFYHLHLRCHMVIDLKVVPFKPEFAGKMNFYLSAVDDQLRHPDDQPSIGLILCKERNRLVVEYALRDTKKPMGVATYRALPRKLKGELPTARQIEKGIGKT